MWCQHCQQDVPAIADPAVQRVLCPRCGSGLSSGVQSALSTEGEPLTENPRPGLEEATELTSQWGLEDDLRSANRYGEVFGVRSATSTADASSEPRQQRPPSSPGSSSRPAPRRWAGSVGWCLISLGLTAFVAGAVFLGWSTFGSRADLWTLGLPLTVGGQAVLMIGLLMQFEALWQSSREANRALDQLDGELDHLRQTTQLLTSTHSPSSRSFYSHFSQGADPHLLLADLKGQLDMVAAQIARQRRP